MGMVLVCVSLAIQMHHEQVGAEGVSQNLVVQHIRWLSECDLFPIQTACVITS